MLAWRMTSRCSSVWQATPPGACTCWTTAARCLPARLGSQDVCHSAVLCCAVLSLLLAVAELFGALAAQVKFDVMKDGGGAHNASVDPPNLGSKACPYPGAAFVPACLWRVHAVEGHAAHGSAPKGPGATPLHSAHVCTQLYAAMRSAMRCNSTGGAKVHVDLHPAACCLCGAMQGAAQKGTNRRCRCCISAVREH
jgi:hypothetical protein